MAMPSNNYDPNKYGAKKEMLDEGVHEFEIIEAHTIYGKDGNERWEIIMQPTTAAYRTKNGYKTWLNVDGCVNALFDAAGHDPKSVKMMDYKPEMFIGKRVYADVYHAKDKNDENKYWANIKRLHPAFSLGKIAELIERKQPPKAEPFPADDDFGGDEVPF